MYRRGSKANLLINGKPVGVVVVQGLDDSWAHGSFTPEPATFAEFAPLFGRWSLLMHADDGDARLSPAASEELREAEYALDALKAELVFHETNEKRRCAQINIDGGLVEWKEY